MKKKLSVRQFFSLNLRSVEMLTPFVSARIAVTLFAFLLSSSLLAQDVIHKKGGEVLKVTITEVGIDEIKYKKYDDVKSPIYALDKDMIAKVVYENGAIEGYQNKLFDPQVYENQRHRAIKLNLISPFVTGFVECTYEQNVKPGQSFETGFGIIGLGDKTLAGSENARGGFIEGGYKFLKLPDYYSRGIRYTHIMQGSYVRPNLVLGHYTTDKETIEKQSITYGGLTLDMGRQWVFEDRFLVETYVGVGCALDNSDRESVHHFAVAKIEGGLGLRAGLKIGMLFK